MGESLVPLIEFAKETLAGKDHQFKNWPIFLKATGTQTPPCSPVKTQLW